ncbi:MAG: LysR family transcriptional regulator [Dehalococcoidia bacterium]|nr:LysR family transcriptional regulator [Dehalococcoidia bacterium]
MTYENLNPLVPSIQLQQLAYLREAGRSGSLTEAAGRLGLSQPALSQSLTDLERRIGVPLFERAGRRRVLTEAGREAVSAAAEVLDRLDALRDRLEAGARGEAGTVRVGMIDAASLYLLPDAIRQYRKAHPTVDLRLVVDTSKELLRRLRSFDLDVAFVVGPPDDDLSAVAILEEELHVYRGASSTLDARTADWALYPASSRTRQLIEEALAREGIRPRVTLESANPEILRQMVALGLAWSVLPAAVAESGRVVLKLVRGTALVTRTLVAVRRLTASPDARVAALLELAMAAGSASVSEPRS